MADGLHGHGRQGVAARTGRRQQPQQQFRGGRQETGAAGDLAQYADAGTGSAAPLSNYGANDAGLNDAASAGDDNLVKNTPSISNTLKTELNTLI